MKWVRIHFNETNLADPPSAGFYKDSHFGVASLITALNLTPTTAGDTYVDFAANETIDNLD